MFPSPIWNDLWLYIKIYNLTRTRSQVVVKLNAGSFKYLLVCNFIWIFSLKLKQLRRPQMTSAFFFRFLDTACSLSTLFLYLTKFKSHFHQSLSTSTPLTEYVVREWPLSIRFKILFRGFCLKIHWTNALEIFYIQHKLWDSFSVWIVYNFWIFEHWPEHMKN